MNYLAHLFLSPGPPQFMAGALAGDFLHGRLDESLSRELLGGIRLHRAIDAFADAHRSLGESRRRLGAFRHHARIIVDVFYDHLLARQFSRYSDVSLDDFAAATYETLRDADVSQIPRLSEVIARMREHDWLTGYARLESIQRALFYLSRRLKRHVALERSVEILEERYSEFESDFLRFFPDALAFATEWREANATSF